MNNKKSTKRTLMSSVLSLVLCMAMLIGTTFAWFTDSVTSGNNKIVAGNLKIDLEVLEEDNTTWTSIKDDPQPIFNYEYWEPGYTEVKILKVVNEGTLALKWKAMLTSENVLSDLANVIDVYVKEDVTAYSTDRTVLDDWTKVGTLASFVSNLETTTVGELNDGESETLGLAFKMQESAGNEYQGMDLGGSFDICITATQLTAEEDSFDDQYDKDADYDGEISNATSLAAALQNGGTYKVTSNIALDSAATVPAGVTVNLNLGSKTISAASGNTIDNNGTLTVTNGTVSSSTAYTILNKGTLTVDNAVIDNGINNSGAITVESGKISTTRGGSSHAIYHAGTALTVNSGEFSGNGNEVINANNSPAVINGGTFEKVGKASYLLGGSSMVINGGTFIAFAPAATNPVRSNVTIKGGTFNYKPTAATGCKVFDNGNGTWTVADLNGKIQVADGFYKDEAGANYYVYNANGLTELRTWMGQNSNNTLWNKTYNIMTSINADGVTWETMKMSPDSGTFSGITFNGNGHTISNLTIAGNGLFTLATQGRQSTVPALFKDITFDNVTVNGGTHHTGVIWGEAYGDITVDNVQVINSTITGGCNVGALIGRNFEPTTIKFIDCSVKNTTVEATKAADYAGASAFLGMALKIGESTSINLIFEGNNVAEGNTLITAEGMQGGGIYTIADYYAATWKTPTVVNDFTNYNSNN